MVAEGRVLSAEPGKHDGEAERGCTGAAQQSILLQGRRGQQRGRRNWPVFLCGANSSERG